MGCITSSQNNVEGPSTGEVNVLSDAMKPRFASIDKDVLGAHKEEAMVKLVFVYGKAANVYLITTPPFHPKQAQKESEYTEENKGKEQAAEYPDGNAPEKKEEAKPEEVKAEEVQQEEVKEIRWTMFNDSKSDAKVEATFFHAEALRSANEGEAESAAPAVHLERFDGGRVKATVDVPAGATVAFVEGPIKGYMWKCLVHDPKTNNFENAAAAE